MVASAYVNIDFDDGSVESSAENFGIHDWDDIFQDDELVVVVYAVIADNVSFASSPSIDSSTSTDCFIQHLSQLF